MFDWNFWLVTGHLPPGRCQNFIHLVTGHTPRQIDQNSNSTVCFFFTRFLILGELRGFPGAVQLSIASVDINSIYNVLNYVFLGPFPDMSFFFFSQPGAGLTSQVPVWDSWAGAPLIATNGLQCILHRCQYISYFAGHLFSPLTILYCFYINHLVLCHFLLYKKLFIFSCSLSRLLRKQDEQL